MQGARMPEQSKFTATWHLVATQKDLSMHGKWHGESVLNLIPFFIEEKKISIVGLFPMLLCPALLEPLTVWRPLWQPASAHLANGIDLGAKADIGETSQMEGLIFIYDSERCTNQHERNGYWIVYCKADGTRVWAWDSKHMDLSVGILAYCGVFFRDVMQAGGNGHWIDLLLNLNHLTLWIVWLPWNQARAKRAF